MSDPARIDVRGKLSCGRDVEIDVGCIFEGEVSLGDNVRVGAYSIIRHSNHRAGTQIAPYSHIDESEVGANCHIGPYARLRPGTKLYNDAHIGNFVEIKNSEIGQGSKANHLSYIGDSTIGSRVNIGAGTDHLQLRWRQQTSYHHRRRRLYRLRYSTSGASKSGEGRNHRSRFTITVDAPAGELTISRSRQTTMAGWKRPQKGKK